MKNMLRATVLAALAAALVAGCARSEDEKALNTRTPEQQQQADKLYDMGGPSDRKKSKGY